MRYPAALLLLVALAPAQEVLFSDDFSDGDADGWTEMVTGADYAVNGDLWYQLSASGGGVDFAFSQRGDMGSQMSVQDYSVLLRTRSYLPGGESGINIRYMEGPGTAYTLYVDFVASTVYIYRYDSFSSSVQLGGQVSVPGGLSYGVAYWVRFECIGDLLRAKVWTGEPGDEPASWLIQRTDGTYLNNGILALEGGNSYGDDFHEEFDDVTVTSFPEALGPGTWAEIKASFYSADGPSIQD